MKKVFYWIPRALSIIYVLFISIFAFDVFDMKLSFVDTIIALFMHLIPAFLLITAAVIAWKWEFAGAMIYFGLGIFYIAVMRIAHPSWLIIPGISFLTGILFIVSREVNKKNKSLDNK